MSFNKKAVLFVTLFAFICSFAAISKEQIYKVREFKKELLSKNKQDIEAEESEDTKGKFITANSKKPYVSAPILPAGKIPESFQTEGFVNVESGGLVTSNRLEQTFYAEETQGQIGISTDKEEDIIEDNFFTVNIPRQLNQKSSVFLVYDLYGLASHQSVSRSINRNPALGGDLVLPSFKWSVQKEEINPNLLKIGENSIQFTTAAAGIKYKVKNVKIVFEQVSNSLPLHVTSLRTEDKLYIKGFIKNDTSSSLTIQGDQVNSINGEFEKFVTLTEQAKKEGVIQITNNNEQSFYSIPTEKTESKIIKEEKISAGIFEISRGEENHIEYAGATVNIDKADERTGSVKIILLRTKDFSSAGQGLRNVIAESKGYRIKLEGTNSGKKVKITIPYDEKRLGSFSAKEIKTFYFDYKKKKWITIEESKVDEKSKTVSFESNGEGQDYINGVVSVPESPQLNAFAPTTISGLKAGAPYAGVQVISPPTANQKGDARVSYPLNIPSGTNGLQPALSVNYSSSNGNGWMGEGWNISGLSEISIDTRWGSPSFNSQVETELYSLDGEMLVFDGNYLPHRHNDISETSTVFTTKKQKRDTLLSGNKKNFFLRKNHNFSKIERYGSTTKDYRWIVTDTNGTKTYYGGDESGVKEESVIKTDNNHIVRWGVLKIVDVHGNNIKFEYDNFRISNQGGENENLNGGAYFHIKNIIYTGKDNTDGAYSVYFERESSISRPDISMNGKIGTKIVEPFKLINIYVRYNGENIRKYHLEYGQGEFFKTILTSLNEFDSDDEFVNRHRFDYYNDLQTNNSPSPINFGNEVNITGGGGQDAFPSVLPSWLTPSKIAANNTFEWGVNGRIPGVGLDFLFPNPYNGYGHVMASFNIGHSEADAKKAQELMDFNGDGIIDLIYRKPSQGLFLREGNLSSGTLSFGQQKQIQFLNSNFSQTKTKTNSIGYDAGINVFGIGFNWSQIWATSKSDTSSFIIDANSDGVMDVAKDGEILFGRVNPSTTNMEMTRYSDNTENMVIVADAMTQHFSPLDGTWQDVSKNDVVKVWIASRDGTVRFTDNVSVENVPNAKAQYSVEMLHPTDPTRNVRIFLKEFTAASGAQQITINQYDSYYTDIASLLPPNSNDHLALNSSQKLMVKSGDKIFVRLHKYENESFKVLSNPKIEYTDASSASPLLEQDGFITNNGSYSDNYFLNNHTKPFTMNTAGNVFVSVPPVNFTSLQDKITFKIIKVNLTTGSETVIHSQERDQNSPNFSFSSFTTNINVAQNEVPTAIRFVVETDSHQSFKSANWNRISLSYPTGSSVVAAEYPSYYITEFKNKFNIQNYLTSYPAGTQDYKIEINKNISPGSGIPTGSFYYIVKNNGKVVAKRRIINPMNNVGNIVETDLITNQAISGSSPVTFYSGTNPESANLNILVFCHTKADREFFKAYSAIFQNRPFNIYYGAGNTLLFNTEHTSMNSSSLENVSQFYHNWGQFLYNEFADVKPVSGPEGFMLNPETPSDEYGRLINNKAFTELDAPMGLNFPQCNNLPTQNETAQCIANQINTGGMYQNPTSFVPQPIKPMDADIQVFKRSGYIQKWIGIGPEQYAMADSFKDDESATGFFNPQTANPDVPDALTLQGNVDTKMFAINKKYYSKSRTNTLSGSLFGVGAQNASSVLVGDGSVTLQDFMDMNGDGYPDAMYKNAVQLSNSTGGHGALRTNNDSPYGTAFISNSDSHSNALSPIFSTNTFIQSGVALRNGEVSSNPRSKYYLPPSGVSAGIETSSPWSGNLSGNYDSQDIGESYWLDINGDGLSDRITGGGTPNMTYRLNMGYSMDTPRKFSNIETYSSGPVGSIGLSAGFNLQGLTNLPISVSASASAALGSSKTTFEDINGDGLIDILVIGSSTTHVKYNLGNKFSNAVEIVKSNGGIDYNNESKTYRGGISAGGGYYKPIPIVWWPFPPIPLIYLKIGGQVFANVGLSIAEVDKSFKDMNGDGFPDLVVAHNDGFKVNYSTIGRTNKLKTVTRTGGLHKDDWPFSKFELNYTNKLPSYNDAHSRLVLSEVNIVNPEVMEGNHLISTVGKDMVTKYEYKNSHYDRRERDFFGFEEVTSKEMNGTSVYRYSIQRFFNNSYFLNGLLKKSESYSGSGTLLSTNENKFLLYKYSNSNTQINLSPLTETFDTGGKEGRKMAIALLDNTKSIVYENGQSIEINTKMYYNNRSQLTKYQYSSPSSSYTSEINYHTLSNNILNVPRSISVFAGSGGANPLRYRETEVNASTGDITKVVVQLNSNEFAETSMDYDTYGNLIGITYPPNNNSSQQAQQYSLSYQYDSLLNKYVVRVTDSFGVESSAEYDPKFDAILSATDISGNTMKYTYDLKGRITSILAPKEQGISDYTVSYEYFTTEVPSLTESYTLLRGAKTKNYDSFSPDKMIETIVLEDGLGRMVQTKKDIELGGVEKMSVSGRTVFDNLGRVIKTYHPMHENKYFAGSTNTNDHLTIILSPYYSSSAYDVRNRVIQTTDEDGHTSNNSFEIVGNFFKTTTTQLQNASVLLKSEVFSNAEGKTVSSRNFLGANTLTTSFDYNQIGELTTVTDPEGLKTLYNYDLAGRILQVNHPDHGVNNYRYSPAGQILGMSTSNLEADPNISTHEITYEYEFNRLTSVKYPDLPNGNANPSNVTYEYGGAGSGNNTSRLIHKIDGSGEIWYEYGNMGEIVSEDRTVFGFNIPTMNFLTRYNYDSWNRILDLDYHDGEGIKYTYNVGGNLKRVEGNDVYIANIDYDKYEQRTSISYGNGTSSTFQYALSNRRLVYHNLKDPYANDLLSNDYGYDYVGNITSLSNGAGQSLEEMGGSYSFGYNYDQLNRLAEAGGDFSANPSPYPVNNSNFNVQLGYNSAGGIIFKNQEHYQNQGTVMVNTYKNDYFYTPNTHKLEHVKDSMNGIDEYFAYDKNGNVIRHTDSNLGTEEMYWDENDKMKAHYQKDLGIFGYYTYDDKGERVIKYWLEGGSELYQNGALVDGNMAMKGYKIYPNPYVVINSEGSVTKHYFAGTERIASRVDMFDPSMKQNTTTKKRSSKANPDLAEEEFKAIMLKAGIEENKMDTEFEKAAATISGLYYLHGDHLGTATYVTNSAGKTTQFFLNLPFGETMVEQQHDGSYENPYKFNAKELDSETGLYYYGARYYNPRLSIWYGVDPLAEKMPSWSPYAYAFDNPVRFIDPDGRSPLDIIYLNANGTINRVVNNGSNYITVVGADGKGRLLGSLNVSRSLTNWNNENRQIVANVVAYYGGKIGAKGFTSTYERSDSSVAYYSSGDGRITVNPQSNGYLHPTLNNKYDLMNVLYHENRHKYDDKNNNEASTFFSHANVAYETVNHWTFKNSSETHQRGEVGYFSALIMNSYYQENNEKADSLINKFNSSNSGYKLNFIKHKGIMEITMPNGKTGQVKYEKSNNAPNLK